MSFGLVGDPQEVEDPNAALAAADSQFVGADIDTDTQEIVRQVYDALVERAPGWEAHDGNPDVWLTEAYSQVGAEIRALARDVPEDVFITFFTEVLGRPIRPPAPATGYATWKSTGLGGHIIRVGEQITLTGRNADDLVGFETVEGAEIPIGEDTVSGVAIVAVEPGTDANGLSGEAEAAEPPDWLDSITVESPTEGGDDGQDRRTYLDSLTNLLRMMAFRPILPLDYALLTLQVPGVGRAIAMDGYNPDTDTWGHTRTITVVVADPDGKELSDTARAFIRTELEAAREVNFLIFIESPKYVDVDVTFAVAAFAGQSPEIVEQDCIEAITEMLSPARWRLGTTSPSIEAGEVIPPPAPDQPPNRQIIRVNDLIGLLDRTRAVDHVISVEINGAAQDFELTGPTTLPEAGSITGTVTV